MGSAPERWRLQPVEIGWCHKTSPLCRLEGEPYLRELIDRASGYSGAADDELTAQRIAEQEAELERLKNRRTLLAG